jgi:nitrogen fixation NifU-like protein
MEELLYRERILDHYRYPRNFGFLKKATHTGGLRNISCGDAVQFRIRAVKGKIADIGFTGDGCAISMAGASLTSEYAKGKSVSLIQKMTKKDIEKILQIPISGARERCAMLAIETLKQLEKI